MGESGEPCFIFPEEGTDDEKADYTSYKPQIRIEWAEYYFHGLQKLKEWKYAYYGYKTVSYYPFYGCIVLF